MAVLYSGCRSTLGGQNTRDELHICLNPNGMRWHLQFIWWWSFKQEFAVLSKYNQLKHFFKRERVGTEFKHTRKKVLCQEICTNRDFKKKMYRLLKSKLYIHLWTYRYIGYCRLYGMYCKYRSTKWLIESSFRFFLIFDLQTSLEYSLRSWPIRIKCFAAACIESLFPTIQSKCLNFLTYRIFMNNRLYFDHKLVHSDLFILKLLYPRNQHYYVGSRGAHVSSTAPSCYAPLICALRVNRLDIQRHAAAKPLTYEKNYPSFKEISQASQKVIKFHLKNKTNKTRKEANKRKVYVAALVSNKETGARGRGWALPNVPPRPLGPASSCPSFWWNAWHAPRYGCGVEGRWASETQTFSPGDAQPSLLLDACGACLNQLATCQALSASLQNLEIVAES